ncbi:MAG: DUF368 domain-containing protein [Treponema sp.]|nr:DUF368 domain-containing protein [Treponema sp.]
MNFIRLLLIGIVIGMANVIPGVSGGTLAVVFNIYDKFVNAITLNLKKLKENWRFVVPLLTGMASGVLIFSKLITVLYTNFPVQTNFFFTGLILGSIPMLFAAMTKTKDDEKMGAGKTISVVLCALVGLALLLTFSYLEVKYGGGDKTAGMTADLPEWTVKLAARIFFAGLVGAVAMIVPGISGSLLMLILGVYPIVMKSIPALFLPSQTFHALILLLPNGAGVLIGLLSGAQLVKYLLKKVPNHTYAVIFGLLCGSAFNLFPGFSAITGIGMAIVCALCVIIGAAMAYFSTKLAPAEANTSIQQDKSAIQQDAQD